VEHYAHTALMDMLTTAATGPDLAGVLGSLSCQRPVMDALIEGMGPVVSMLLQVTLGLGGRAAAGTVSLGSAEDELRISGRDLMRAVLQAVVNAASAAQERVPGGVDGPDGVRRPLRPRPLDRTRELRYRGPWRLPGPDSPAGCRELDARLRHDHSFRVTRPGYWTHVDPGCDDSDLSSGYRR